MYAGCSFFVKYIIMILQASGKSSGSCKIGTVGEKRISGSSAGKPDGGDILGVIKYWHRQEQRISEQELLKRLYEISSKGILRLMREEMSGKKKLQNTDRRMFCRSVF